MPFYECLQCDPSPFVISSKKLPIAKRKSFVRAFLYHVVQKKETGKEHYLPLHIKFNESFKSEKRDGNFIRIKHIKKNSSFPFQ